MGAELDGHYIAVGVNATDIMPSFVESGFPVAARAFRQFGDRVSASPVSRHISAAWRNMAGTPVRVGPVLLTAITRSAGLGGYPGMDGGDSTSFYGLLPGHLRITGVTLSDVEGGVYFVPSTFASRATSL